MRNPVFSHILGGEGFLACTMKTTPVGGGPLLNEAFWREVCRSYPSLSPVHALLHAFLFIATQFKNNHAPRQKAVEFSMSNCHISSCLSQQKKNILFREALSKRWRWPSSSRPLSHHHSFFSFSFISLIADGPLHYHPACGH